MSDFKKTYLLGKHPIVPTLRSFEFSRKGIFFYAEQLSNETSIGFTLICILQTKITVKSCII